jgi:hypothetical protein
MNCPISESIHKKYHEKAHLKNDRIAGVCICNLKLYS